MELILLILKIILIAFLSMLGVLFFLLGVVLFVPIKYEVSGSIGDAWEVSVKGKVTYLLSAIKFAFSFENKQFDWKLFLMGFEKKFATADTAKATTMDTEDAEPEPEEPSKTNLLETEVAEADLPNQEEKEELKTEASTFSSNVTKIDEAPVVSEKNSESANHKGQKRKPKKEKKQKQKSNIDFAFIKQQITDKHNQSVVRKIWSELVYLLRHFKFRKIVTDLIFATGDPATTGQTLGILAIIPTLYRYDFKIVPDFEAEEAYVKGTFLFAGKVRLIHILITVLRLIFDKEVRIVVKRLLRQLEK